MLELEGEIDFAGLNRWIDSKVQRELPFATALSLTWTAKDAQEQVKDDLPDDFTIRRPWVAKGIRIKPARKSARLASIAAKVGSVDDFMALHQTGGKKTGRGGRVANPIGARKAPSAVTPKSRWPGALLKKPGHFLAPLSTGGRFASASTNRKSGGKRAAQRALSSKGATIGLWKRQGRKRVMERGRYKGQRRQPIKLLYVLTASVHVKPRWDLPEQVSKVTSLRLARNFDRALDRALT